MNEIIEKLNLSNDFLFSRVMSDKEICKKILEKILNISIKEIIILEEQKSINLALDSKGIRLDVYVNDDKGTVFNVEMQQANKRNLPKRSRYYQGQIDLDIIAKGELYNSLKQSYVIFICTFDPFKKGRHLYTFQNICNEDHTILLDDKTTKVFLNTTGIMEDIDEELEEFLGYVETSTNEYVDKAKTNLVKDIHKRVIEVKASKETEVTYMTLMQHEREIKEEAREEALEEGREEGIIKLCLTLEMSNDQIKEKLINILDMTESEAEQSIYRYVK